MAKKSVDIVINGRNRANRAFRSVERMMLSLRRAALSAGAAFATFLGARALIRIATDTSQAIDQTAKLADALGLTTNQLHGYYLAAKITGVGQQQLNTAFQRLSKNISDAQFGLTTAVRAFDTLGISADRLRQMSMDEAFKAVADSMKNIPNRFDKIRVGLDLLGRSGLRVIKTLEVGSAGLTRFQQEAIKSGIAVNRAFSAEVEVANDSMTMLAESTKGLANTIVAAVAPATASAAQSMTQMVRGMQSGIGTVRGAVFGFLMSVGESTQKLTNILHNIGEWVGSFVVNIWRMVKILFGNLVRGMFNAITGWKTILMGFMKVWSDVWTSAQNVAGAAFNNITKLLAATFDTVRTRSLEPFANLTLESLTKGINISLEPLGKDVLGTITEGMTKMESWVHSPNYRGIHQDTAYTAEMRRLANAGLPGFPRSETGMGGGGLPSGGGTSRVGQTQASFARLLTGLTAQQEEKNQRRNVLMTLQKSLVIQKTQGDNIAGIHDAVKNLDVEVAEVG